VLQLGKCYKFVFCTFLEHICFFATRVFKKWRKHHRCNSRVASQIHLVKLDSCFQDLSMLCAKYQSSGIAGSQEEDF
jgi:hypothetical protein